MAMDAPAMSAAELVAAFAAGAFLGAAHFVTLWRSVVLMREGRTALGIAVQALRFVVLAAALVVIARQGPWLFLAAAAGVLVVRALFLRRARRPA
jgi:F1F0 ATPase subunit 2